MLAPLAAALLTLLPPQEPVATAERAVAAAVEQHGDGSIEHADALLKLGTALGQQRRDTEGLAVVLRCLEIRREKLPAKHRRIAIAATNAAGFQLQLGDFAAALPLLEEARAIFAEGTPAPGAVGAANNLVYCHAQMGQLAAARTVAEGAAEYGRRHFPDHPYTAVAVKSLAGMHVLFGDIDAARRLVEEALQLLERTEPGSARHAETLAGLVEVFLYAERVEDALPLQRRVLVLREAPPVDPVQLARDLLQLARIEHQLGRRTDARMHADAGLARMPADAAPRDRAYVHSTYAQIVGASGEHRLARQHAELALAAAAGSANAAVHSAVLAHLEILAGDAGAGVERLKAAFPDLDLEAIARPTTRIEARLALARGLRAVAEPAAAIAALRQNLVELPRYLDRCVPGLLEHARLEAVARQRASLHLMLAIAGEHPEALPAAAQHEEVLLWKGQVARASRRQLQALHAEPERAAQLRRLGQLRNQIAAGEATADARAELQRLESTLSRELPFVDPRASLGGLQKRLGAGMAFVDWIVLDAPDGVRRLAAFVVRPDRATVRVDCGAWEPCAAAIDAALRTTARATRTGAAKLQEAASAALRTRVIAPLEEALAGCREICISPDGALACVPFETLPGARPSTFLVEEFAIHYLQNGLELLAAPCEPEAPARLLAAGGIDYGPAGPSSDGGPVRSTPRPFRPLPATAGELDDVVKLWSGPSTVLRGAEASEAVIAASIGAATFVHLATHGFAGMGDDEFAGLALASANAPSGGHDGILSAAEAELLDLQRCRIVVLSACQTGLGRPTAGESLLGLRRSLHIAGARATMTSLWRVDDAATATLMVDFYRALWQQGQPPAQALRTAQLAALARARQQSGEGLPGLWGAFVVEGR